MAPNLYDSTCTTTSGNWGWVSSTDRSFEVSRFNGKRYETYKYYGTLEPELFWTHHDKYQVSYTKTSIYASREAEQKIKKALKKMAAALCKEGWIDHKPYYLEPRVIPARLQSVRLEGRGWGNRK